MYINEPALKGNHRKQYTTSKAINQYEFSTPDQKSNNKKINSRNSGNKNNSKSKQRMDPSAIIDSVEASPIKNDGKGKQRQYKDQIQFQNHLIDELGQLIKKWESSLASVRKQIKKYDDITQNQTQLKAFQHCVALLDSEFSQAQAIHESSRALIDKKILQVEQLKLRLMHDIEKAKQQCKKTMQQNEKMGDLQKQRDKKKAQKKMMQSKVDEQKARIQKIRANLAENKKKSYQQKNQFIELQTQQFRLEGQIRNMDQQQQKIQQQVLRYKKYQQLLKIKQKILNSHQKIQEQARPHLQRKIQKMARLRSQTNNIDQVLQVCLQKTQDQNIIIEALKQKSYHEETYHSDQPNLYEMYLKKYNNIYFGDQAGKDSWNDYSSYLKHLLNRNRDYNQRVYSEMPEVGMKKYSMNDLDRKKARLYTQGSLSGNEVLDLRPNMKRLGNRDTQDKFGNNSTKISNNPQKYRSQRIPKKQPQGTKLPRLVKLQGKAAQQKNIKDNVKKGIIKNTNKQQDFSLQSIRSNDSRISGQIIQVQFHKK